MGTPGPAPFESLERLGHGLVSHLRQRLELIALEVTEEEIRFSRLLGWQLMALFLACLSIALGALLVIAAFWDGNDRLWAIGAVLAISACAAGAFWWIYRRLVRGKPIVLAQTIEELRRDADALAPGGKSRPPAGPGLVP
jgi:uncharacterized membrane protein YqjE